MDIPKIKEHLDFYKEELPRIKAEDYTREGYEFYENAFDSLMQDVLRLHEAKSDSYIDSLKEQLLDVVFEYWKIFGVCNED